MILITGMTSAHCRQDRGLTFAQQIKATCEAAGHEVVMQDPPLEWNRDFFGKFDKVFIGLAPLTSTAANRMYGALAGMAVLHSDPRLTLFIDTPNARHVQLSIDKMANDSLQLTRPFYKAWKHYDALLKNQTVLGRIYAELDMLTDSYDWPPTIYPALPFSGELNDMPYGSHAVNLDEMCLQASLDVDEQMTMFRRRVWLATNAKDKWTISLSRTVHGKVESLYADRLQSEANTRARLSKHLGLIHNPQRNGQIAWSPAVATALATLAPVITDWEQSMTIGSAWSLLAATVESLPESQHRALAIAQRDEYLDAINGCTETFIERFINNKENA